MYRIFVILLLGVLIVGCDRKPSEEEVEIVDYKHVPQEAVDLIKKSEGLRLKAYLDTGGVWTIGYGSIKSPLGVKLNKYSVIIEEEAERWLRHEIEHHAIAVDQNVKVELNKCQYSALVSFVFNVGIQAFKTSTLVKQLNQGDYLSVPAQLSRWKYDNGKVIQGLLNRRIEEGELFTRKCNG